MAQYVDQARYSAAWAELGLADGQFPVQEISAADLSVLTDRVFGLDNFYVHTAELTPIGCLLRGSMRLNDAALVSTSVQERLAAQPGLSERVRLFLLADPLFAPSEDDFDVFAELPLPEPVYLALPAQVVPLAAQGRGAGTPLASPVSTLFSVVTTSSASLALCGADPEQSVPLLSCVWGLLALHEAAHMAAALKHKLAVRPPVFLPSALLGTFGAHLPLASFSSNRSVLADVSMAGPLAGGFASLSCFLAGLGLTADASSSALSHFPALPFATLHSSLLLSLLAEAALPPLSLSEGISVGGLPPEALPLHPLAVAGFIGTLCNALALVPCGRLDGGRAATACFGRRVGGVFGGVSVVAVVVAMGASPDASLLVSWALAALVLFRQAESPSVDEFSDPPPNRKTLFLTLLTLAALVLWPAPHAIAPEIVSSEQLADIGL